MKKLGVLRGGTSPRVTRQQGSPGATAKEKLPVVTNLSLVKPKTASRRDQEAVKVTEKERQKLCQVSSVAEVEDLAGDSLMKQVVLVEL